MKKNFVRNWYLISAEKKVLGRLATKIAQLLQGKNLTTYDPAIDMGNFVIVTNCEKIKLTGKKAEQKIYQKHTGFMGGIKKRTFKEMLATKPTEIIKKAVSNMLPKNKLRKVRLSRLKIYSGLDYPHKEQKVIEIK